MPNVSLMSFLKIFGQGTPQKAREYGKYLTPGGYDFYWQLKEAATSLTVQSVPFANCVKQLQSIRRDVEKKHNLAGLESLNRWISTRAADFFMPPHATCLSPKGYLTVKLEPEFGMTERTRRLLVHIWNCKGAELTQATAGVGIYLMREHLAVRNFGDCACAILDLRKLRLFVADAIPARIPAMVTSEFAWVDNFFEQARRAA